MFNNMKFYFHPAKLSRARKNVFSMQVTNYGGQIVDSSKLATHVIIEESCDYSALPISLWSSETIVVGSLWLSQCLKKNSTTNIEQYTINKPYQKRDCRSPDPTTSSKKLKVHSPNGLPPNSNLMKYPCSEASIKSSNSVNIEVINQLQKLADAYKSKGDQWRAHGYEKAISAIRRYGKEVTTYEEVAALEGVGAKTATKVMEIISTGRLRKIEELCETEESKVMGIFSHIWGAGPSTASAWYLKGHRTLSDLTEKEHLTKQQQVGVKYYEEFLMKMSRDEVSEIGKKVTVAAKQVNSLLTTILCGSYRRGKEKCGDVDVVVIKPDEMISKDVLTSILNILKNSGFVTHDLVSLEKSGNQRKYLGVCKLPGNSVHRRLDIFVVPQSESACAILHYTGSALFNRSIRLLAAKKGMHLSEHSLAAGVVRQGKEILNEGHVLSTPTEQSIFTHLGLEYRPPEERDH